VLTIPDRAERGVQYQGWILYSYRILRRTLGNYIVTTF
jgi:hypothetical protein